jgi:hypothetical protein
MKERVVFQTNVPVTAALAYADGIKVEGRYGDQVMYSLTDERVMYVPPAVRDKLIELGIRQNQLFSICKAERREGNRRFIDWAVRRIEAEQRCVAEPVNGGNRFGRSVRYGQRSGRGWRRQRYRQAKGRSRQRTERLQRCPSYVAGSTGSEHRCRHRSRT